MSRKKMQETLRRRAGGSWVRLFRGTASRERPRDGIEPGRYWTPDPLGAISYVSLGEGGYLHVATLAWRGLRVVQEAPYDMQAAVRHPGDAPSPAGIDVQRYEDDVAENRIIWDPEKRRRVKNGESWGPPAFPVRQFRFQTWRLVSDLALERLRPRDTHRVTDRLFEVLLD